MPIRIHHGIGRNNKVSNLAIVTDTAAVDRYFLTARGNTKDNIKNHKPKDAPGTNMDPVMENLLEQERDLANLYKWTAILEVRVGKGTTTVETSKEKGGQMYY